MDTYKEFKRHFANLLGELQAIIAEAEGNQRKFMKMVAATLEGAYKALLIFDGDVTPAVELLPESPKPDKKAAKKSQKKEQLPKWGVEVDSPKLLEALGAFEKMRERKKRPMTDLARHQLYQKLIGLSQDEETQIAILVQSIFNSWNGVFPLHSSPAQKEPTRADKDAAEFQKTMLQRFMEGKA